MARRAADVVICGAGIAGVATAYFLSAVGGIRDVVIVDPHAPLSQTSSRSGENYRSWWPHPVMARLTSRSITLMEELARASGNMFQMHRRGYLYASFEPSVRATLAARLEPYGHLGIGSLRIRDGRGAEEPYRAKAPDLDDPLDGADLLLAPDLIQAAFPQLGRDVRAALHVRRAGAVSAQQLGTLMLEQARAAGTRLWSGKVVGFQRSGEAVAGVEVLADGTTHRLATRRLVVAAGPFVGRLLELMGITLPLSNVFQEKIAIRDPLGAVPRDAPFTILLDAQRLEWSSEEHREWEADPQRRWLLDPLPGGVHVRPEGGRDSEWIKLGWAFNRRTEVPSDERPGTPEFPEVVVRGACRMVPGLRPYIGRLPTPVVHYGGYYTKTPDALPVVGPLGIDGVHVVGGLAGYGTMAACAVGELASAWVVGAARADYADSLLPGRLLDARYLASLSGEADRGEL